MQSEIRERSKVRIIDWANKKKKLAMYVDRMISGAGNAGETSCYLALPLKDYPPEILKELNTILLKKGYRVENGKSELMKTKEVVFVYKIDLIEDF